jgi:hypothetical protein
MRFLATTFKGHTSPFNDYRNYFLNLLARPPVKRLIINLSKVTIITADSLEGALASF